MGICTMEDERNWFVGVDWASETHHVRVSDARGRKLGARAFAHSGEGLAAMAAWILEVTGAAPRRSSWPSRCRTVRSSRA